MGRLITAQRVLQVLVDAGRQMTVPELHAAFGPEPQGDIYQRLRPLIARGLAKHVRRGVYEATAAGRIWLEHGEPIRQGMSRAPKRFNNTIGQRVWRILRIQKRMALAELCQLTEARTESVRRYMGGLASAGYCKRYGNPGATRWLLIQDTGPQAPVWDQVLRRFHDPNTGLLFCPLKPTEKRNEQNQE
jgi:hypothetical protein